ncbi:hypothetical protein V6N13_128899 [Hibiscus sabdariffa]|uniref:DUF4408 domain-containing protein n=1 Tax=Hibiscus sabdariffa TaxID=183260 RepID=A0ABR2SJI6_9ROSI
MEHFLLTSPPCIWSSFSNPKCLFIVVNVIVIFLVGESRVVIGSNKSPVGGDVYDEFVERSRSRVRRIEASSNEDKGIDCKEDVIRCESESTEDVIRCESESKEERTCENVGEENGNEIVEDEQVVELPAEELNKRVEEFIARVNKQRWMEAQLLCLFIVVNVIVIFLVGESRVVTGSNKSPVGGDIYNEYVERSPSRVKRIEAGSNENEGMDCKEKMVTCESESTEDVIRREFESEEEQTCENVAKENQSEIVEDEQVIEFTAEELNKKS